MQANEQGKERRQNHEPNRLTLRGAKLVRGKTMGSLSCPVSLMLVPYSDDAELNGIELTRLTHTESAGRQMPKNGGQHAVNPSSQ